MNYIQTSVRDRLEKQADHCHRQQEDAAYTDNEDRYVRFGLLFDLFMETYENMNDQKALIAIRKKPNTQK